MYMSLITTTIPMSITIAQQAHTKPDCFFDGYSRPREWGGCIALMQEPIILIILILLISAAGTSMTTYDTGETKPCKDRRTRTKRNAGK